MRREAARRCAGLFFSPATSTPAKHIPKRSVWPSTRGPDESLEHASATKPYGPRWAKAPHPSEFFTNRIAKRRKKREDERGRCRAERRQRRREVKGEALRSRESKATKGVRWMPWRQAPKKDVEHCEKPRGAVCRRYIRGCPNGETHRFVARLGRYPWVNT